MPRIIEMKSENNYTVLDSADVGKAGSWINRIPEIIKWMEEKGISAGVSRYSRYEDYIRDFSPNPSKRIAPGKILLPTDLEELFRKANLTLLEIVQIIWVYDSFREENSKGFHDRLKKAVSGQDLYIYGVQDNGRDFLYELLIASWFQKKGYKIAFDLLTDVVATKNDTKFYIECKRLRTAKKYEERCKDGCKQLKMVEESDAYKLVFIDIYNCISDNVPPYEYKDIYEINLIMEKAIHNYFISPNEAITNRILKEYAGTVDGIVFTSICNMWLSDVSARCYLGSKMSLNKEMHQCRFDKIVKALNKCIAF